MHIVSGGLAIVLGAIALMAVKGGFLHRRSGLLFVFAMLTMGISGSLLALRQSLTNSNVLGGFMSAYFVVTALTAVRPNTRTTRWLNGGALAVAAALAATDAVLGLTAFRNPRGMFQGVPFAVLFFLAAITTLAAAGDVRMMRTGALARRRRLARHLWRMSFALFIAAASFFSSPRRVAELLPAPLATPMMRALPVLLVFLAMFYWLWRVRFSRRSPGFARAA